MALESRITQEEIKKEPEKPIDREKVKSAIWFQSRSLFTFRGRGNASLVC